MSVLSVVKKYPATYWASNVIELFERWAWYGFYLAFALYLVNSKDTGALGFSQAQKGWIMGTGSMLLYFLPVITGAIADKIGYKKILFLAFSLYITGYFMIRHFDSFGMVFFAFVWTCVGGAFFKPIVSAMIARTTTKETASIGFGIFYMMVNIGGFLGPFIAGIMMGKSWDYVFYMSMITIGINFLITFFFFREPIQKKEKGPLGKDIWQALKNIVICLEDWKYLLFLIIMILFWTAFNQLYYSFPVFIDTWVNTSVVYASIHSVWPWMANLIADGHGGISAVTMSSMDSFYIIIFQIFVSTFVMRFRPLAAMVGGTLIISGGLNLMFAHQNGWLVLLGILVFSLGEMGSSPKFTEYVGRIAPSDKKALYMGTSFLPIAAGNQIAGWLSGTPYEHVADKIYLLKKDLLIRGIHVPDISLDFSKNDFLRVAAQKLNMTNGQLNDYLWNTYHPGHIWYLYSGIAASAMIALWLYDHFVMKGQ